MKTRNLILFVMLLVFCSSLLAANRERSFNLAYQWNTKTAPQFVTIPADVSDPNFIVTADILETPGEILTTKMADEHCTGNMESCAAKKESCCTTVAPSALRIMKIKDNTDPGTHPNLQLFLQLAAFPTQWKVGDTLRLTVNPANSTDKIAYDFKIEKGKKDIFTDVCTFVGEDMSNTGCNPEKEGCAGGACHAK
jgi:hypothetical protein